MLIVGHHLREERPLHHAHHRGLFLIVGLQGDREKKGVFNQKEVNVLEAENGGK